MSLKKTDEDDVLEIFKKLNSNLPDNRSSMDDGALALWYDKRKSKNFAELEKNVSSAMRDRTTSLQNFISIAFQIATFNARVDYELELFVHQIRMMAHAEREKILELMSKEVDIYRKRIENKMLGMEYGLANLDYQMKKAILLKVNPVEEDEDSDEDYNDDY
jgi:hypothetical protein